MRVMAHRGFSSQAPENTLAAFRKAIDFGCKWIELDVQLTADNVPVVIHDQQLDRCTSGHGKVSSYTLFQLKQFSAGNWYAPEFINETIPTLEEVLTLANEHQVNINIELKPYPGDDEKKLAQQVTSIINKVKINSEQILFSSFSVTALHEIKHALPHIKQGLLWEKMPDNAFTILASLNAYSVHCNYRFLSEQQARTIKDKGYNIYCYTPNNPMDVQSFWIWGVDMMITDMPDRYVH